MVANDVGLLVESLLQGSPGAVALIASDGRCVSVNRAYEALLGPGPVAGYSVLRDGLMGAPGATGLVRDVLDGGAPSSRRHDDGRGALEVSVSPVRTADGAVRYAVVWYKDVTEDRAQLVERSVLRALFENAPEALVVADARTGAILDLNPQAVAIFGYARDALIGASHLSLSWPEQADGRTPEAGIAEAVVRAGGGEPVELDWTYRTASGEQLPCELQIARVPDGDRVLCRATIIDLRAREAAEAEQARLLELEVQNRQIVEANRLKSEFLAAMSHELRTPLNSIIGFAELLHDGSVSPADTREFLGDIVISSRHLLRLVNDVLDLAKVEAGKLELHPEPVVLERALAEVAGVFRTQAHHKRIGLAIERDPALEVVRIDALRLKQVLYNFLSNAIKFTPAGGRVILRARAESAAWFVVEVEDSGPGIAADQLGRLFTDFAQLGTGASQAEGSGLGLALSRRLVEAQGGTVGVRSESGRGSVFHARLPR